MTEENALLKRENESLRSLAQGGGEFAVPQEWVTRVEKEFGLRYLSSPVIHRLAYEELRDRITASIESRYGPSGIDDRQEAYKAIGWLRGDDDLLAQLTAVRSVGVRGWFDEVSGEAWVTDRFEIGSVPDQAALVRLLSRILLHQHFPPPPAYPGDDAARAREALHGGAAAGAEGRFYAAAARTNGFVPVKENLEAKQLLQSLPTFMQGLTAFSSAEGKGVADNLHVQGNELFLAAFRKPPQTTRAILHPGGAAAEPQPLGLPVTSEDPFLTESAGLLGLRLWLEPAGEDASRIADAWKNDRYVLFPDGETGTAVLWDIELSSPEAADRLEGAARKLVVKMAAVAGRHLVVSRPSSMRIRFLNTAEAVTAEALSKATF